MFLSSPVPHHANTPLVYAIIGSILLSGMTLYVGMLYARPWKVFSLIGTSVLLGAQPAAVASLALGLHPLTGGVISVLSNLIPVPIFMVAWDTLLDHWKWLHAHVQDIQKWSYRFGRRRQVMVALLAPFIGSYACLAIGDGLQWRARTTLLVTFSTTIISVFAITYGEHWLLHLLSSSRKAP